MNSNVLNSLGFRYVDPFYLIITIGILFLMLIVMFVVLLNQGKEIKRLRKRMNKFMSGKDAESLEEEIIKLVKDNKSLKHVVDISKKDIEVLFEQMRKTYQKTGLIKYDAFQQMGGQLSFCLAMLDQDNNGFIMNSVHSTEGCYCYTKEVKKGVSELSLGKEEEEALALAVGEDRI